MPTPKYTHVHLPTQPNQNLEKLRKGRTENKIMLKC